jgi:predicted naringenin-chalcone synthase
MPHITAISTAVPERRYAQMAAYHEHLAPILGSNPRAERIFAGSAIAYRHSVIDPKTFFERPLTTRERNDLYIQHANDLGEEAIRRCLEQSGTRPEEIDTLLVISCTGYEIPGLDLTLAKRIGLRPDVRRTCILGMGCYAAFPGINRARESVLAFPDSKVLVLAIELCSLHFQHDDSDEMVVSNALFADGAAAILLEGRSDRPSICIVDTLTLTNTDTLEHMAFHVTDHGYRMVLSAYIPQILGLAVEDFADQLLQRNGLKRQDVAFWVIHPGGKKILDHLQERLGLSDADVRFSREVMRDYGNMSSPTVLFVLDAIHRSGEPKAGDLGVMMAFGPGLTMESCLVRWE